MSVPRSPHDAGVVQPLGDDVAFRSGLELAEVRSRVGAVQIPALGLTVVGEAHPLQAYQRTEGAVSRDVTLDRVPAVTVVVSGDGLDQVRDIGGQFFYRGHGHLSCHVGMLSRQGDPGSGSRWCPE